MLYLNGFCSATLLRSLMGIFSFNNFGHIIGYMRMERIFLKFSRQSALYRIGHIIIAICGKVCVSLVMSVI